MSNIMGRESVHKQCYECANCELPKIKEGGSRFHCSFCNREFGTWHYDVPNECPCKGKGWREKGGAKHNPRLITEEDIRWEENLLRIVSGLAALAEAYAEGCDTELMALHYSLKSLRELMEDSVEDLKERIKL